MSDGSFDFEAALLTTILDSKDIRTVVRQKVTAEFFNDPVNRACFVFLKSWFDNPNYGDVPSWESFGDSFQGFEPVRVEESITALCDKLRERKLYADINGMLVEISEQTAGDPIGGFDMLKKKVVGLTAAHTVDETSTLRSSLSDIRREYEAMRDGSTKLKGHAYPWPALNDATLGLQDEQLVFFYGRPKSGKTWLLTKIATFLHEHGVRPLILSQELSGIEMKRRYVAVATGVDYKQFQRGQLPPQTERDFLDNLDAFEEQEEVVFSQLVPGEECITDLMAHCDEYKPNVICIDGVNYLSTDWKELAKILRGLKRVCQAKHIPIVGTTHANRSKKKGADIKEEADDFAYADAFYQVCDLGVRITSEIEDKKARQARCFTAAIREGSQVLFTVNMFLAENLTQKSVEQIQDEDEDIEGQIDAAADNEVMEGGTDDSGADQA